jgi:hypothetical protein
MQEWTEVAPYLFSVPVAGGLIYRYGRRHDNDCSIVFAPYVQLYPPVAPLAPLPPSPYYGPTCVGIG